MVDRPAGNPRANCNGKPVTAVGIFYKSNVDYVGQDNIVIDVDFKAEPSADIITKFPCVRRVSCLIDRVRQLVVAASFGARRILPLAGKHSRH